MYYFKKISVIIFVVLCSKSIVAQNKLNNITLGLNLTSFLDKDAGIRTGIGVDVGKRTSLYSELGYLFYDAYRNKTTNKNTLQGFIIKPSFRYYFNQKKSENILKGGYVAGELMIKSVKYYQNDPIDINDALGNIAYRYIGGYTFRKNVLGFSVLWGNKFFVDRNKKLGFDFYTGLGVRNRNLKYKDLPENVRTINNSVFTRRSLNTAGSSENQEVTGNFSLGIRIIYRIN
jgi:Protein of unknown function (DUF3575)